MIETTQTKQRPPPTTATPNAHAPPPPRPPPHPPPPQHRPGVPDQALALAGHLQPVIPPRIIHDEERSCLGNDMVWLPGNFPAPGALFAHRADPAGGAAR